MQGAAEELWSRLCQLVGRGPRRIAVVGMQPGDGVTTTSVGLCHFLGKRMGLRPVLVEANLRAPSAQAAGLGPLGSVGLHGYWTKRSELEDVVFALDPLAFHLVPAGEAAASPLALVDAGNLSKTSLVLGSHFDLVVYDAPALHTSPEAFKVLAHCEATILVLRSGRVSPEIAAHWLARIEAEGGRVGAVCVNDVRAGLPTWLRQRV